MNRRGPNERWEAGGHHINYYASMHEAHPATLLLRRMPGLITPGPRPIHNEIHSALEYVPPMSAHMAQHALKWYQDEPDDNVRSLDNLMRAIERAKRNGKADMIELAVADVALQAYDIQRPFIRRMQDAREQRRLHIA